MTEFDKVMLFAKSLKPSTAKEIEMREPDRLSEAIIIATKSKQCDQFSKNSNKPYHKPDHRITPHHSREVEKRSQTFRKPWKTKEKIRTETIKTKSTEKIQCYSCKEYGHYSSDCPK
jgi:hypothetical protein